MKNPYHLSIGIALSPDGTALGAAVVEARPVPPLRVVSIERRSVDADFVDVVRWFAMRGGDVRKWELYDAALRERRHVLVESSHFTLGRPFVEALWYSDARRRWEPRLSAIELTSVDLATPQRDGWRVKVSRREVVSALLLAMASGALDVSGVDRSLGRDLRAQLEKLTQWRDRESPDGAGGELALAVAVAVWDAAKTQRRLGQERPWRTT